MNKEILITIGLVVTLSHGAWAQTTGVRRPSRQEIQNAVQTLPETYRKDAQKALTRAGKNGRELIKAIESVSAPEREGMAFLLVNMPRRDLRSLSAELLTENLRFAYQVREEVPWGPHVPEDIFLNYVLPYASVNERRDNWRRDFYERFINTAKEHDSIEKTVHALNQSVFKTLEVSYHATKRPKPDQSPYESVDAHYASCTGLSILLIDALRAVGIPSRLVGIEKWKEGGNHTWVEVWDSGRWHYIGAAEPGPYNQTWFTKRVAQIDPSVPEQRIYAVSFKRTRLKFPLVWNPRIRYVYAVDVTEHYRK